MSDTSSKTPEPVAKPATETPAEDTAPPPMPKRPLSASEQAVKDLKEAFPGVEDKYVKMALIASQGQLDPAFTALLFLSDPTSDITIPDVQTKPKLSARNSFDQRKQVESDEALARRLARNYEGRAAGAKTAPPKPKRKPVWAAIEDDGSEKEDDFVDSLAKNVEEARNTVGGWLGNIAKKIQTEVNTVQQGQGENQLFNALGRKSSVQSSRTSRDSTSPPPARPVRPQKTESVAEVERDVAGIKLEDATTETEQKKNAPISTIDPAPVADDTFAVDDSDEEEEKKEEAKKE
ncbi:hypothetical protein OGAPHI_001151 [Ogataea philodendri]|uniref:CUE domain-containing protein n=1 Tax=Ogataea philodendri TaxID=1378263 RepID=A0A9P8T995_9ASCO|nr:uncharacterized protein OGAPHI_001151 [Ogataea philodendri]KAH3670636.1 hypothetical protein OGAPHI_001151 [Ogataea philodendri]